MVKWIAGDKGDGFIAVEGVRGCSLNLETNNGNASNLFPEIVIVFRA